MSFSRAIEGRLFVGGNIDAKNRRKLTDADLDVPGAPKAQAIVAKNNYRPGNPESVGPRDLARLVAIDLATVDHDFGGREKANAKFFADASFRVKFMPRIDARPRPGPVHERDKSARYPSNEQHHPVKINI